MQLADELVERGCEIGRDTAAKLLEQSGHRRRSLRKELITGQADAQDRDRQFRYIDALPGLAQAGGNPVLCVATKKKELRGRLHRTGQCYSTDAQSVYDHDFRHLANALLVPHGVDDYFGNTGFMTLPGHNAPG
jgi:hypothetical protein